MEHDATAYEGYKSEQYAHYRNIEIGAEKEETKGRGEPRVKPIFEKRKVPFEEIKQIRLDRNGTLAPSMDTEDFTMVSNYLLDFWGAVMGAEAVQLYIHLKRYAYGKKDYCYPDMGVLSSKMNKSRASLKKYLTILEDHGFVMTFLRLDVTNKNQEVSPFFKIRRYVPLITEEMYEGLNPKLQKLHDRFLEEYVGTSYSAEFSPKESMIQRALDKSERIASKRMQEKIERLARNSKMEEYVLLQLDGRQRMINEDFHEFIKSRISRPAYSMFWDTAVFVTEPDQVRVLLIEEEQLDMARTTHAKWVEEFITEHYRIEEHTPIDYQLMSGYIEGYITEAE